MPNRECTGVCVKLSNMSKLRQADTTFYQKCKQCKLYFHYRPNGVVGFVHHHYESKSNSVKDRPKNVIMNDSGEIRLLFRNNKFTTSVSSLRCPCCNSCCSRRTNTKSRLRNPNVHRY